MAKTSEVVSEVGKVFHFEFWLRFYFLEQKEDKLLLNLTEEQRQKMQTVYVQFWPLVEQMLDIPLNPELSQKIVVEFLQLNMSESKIPQNTIISTLDSRGFSYEMYLFNAWIDLHENQLSQKIYDFEQWIHAFEEWKGSDQGQQMLQSLSIQMHGESSAIN